MAKRDFKPKPLYRKVNTRARRVAHRFGLDYSEQRNSKAERKSEALRGKMVQGQRRGLDYTPLFRFLLSRIDQPWEQTHSEACSRLDSEAAIWWLVEPDVSLAKNLILTGESTYYTGLYIDESGILRITDPKLKNADLWPVCPCCTHTLNGEVFENKFDITRRFDNWERL